MRERRTLGQTPEEIAYIEFLTRGIEGEIGDILPTEVEMLTWVNRTWRDSKGRVRQRNRPQQKRLVRLGNGRAFVPHADGRNRTDDRATEILGGRVPENEISAEKLIEMLEERRNRR